MLNKFHHADALSFLRRMEAESVDCIITSPPYFALRDYGEEGQLGQEDTPEEFVKNLCEIFDEAHRVLKKTGTCFVNIGDTYGGNKPSKCLSQIPSRFAIEMTTRGWILRNEIIWHKPNAMPQSVKDRFTVDFEKVFFFTKSTKYHFEQQFEEFQSDEKDIERQRIKGAAETQFATSKSHSGGVGYGAHGRNKRAVLSINTQSDKTAHVAVFPEELVRNCLRAGCPEGGIVLDFFGGSGTAAKVARSEFRKFIYCDLNADYCEIAEGKAPKTLFCE